MISYSYKYSRIPVTFRIARDEIESLIESLRLMDYSVSARAIQTNRLHAKPYEIDPSDITSTVESKTNAVAVRLLSKFDKGTLTFSTASNGELIVRVEGDLPTTYCVGKIGAGLWAGGASDIPNDLCAMWEQTQAVDGFDEVFRFLSVQGDVQLITSICDTPTVRVAIASIGADVFMACSGVLPRFGRTKAEKKWFAIAPCFKSLSVFLSRSFDVSSTTHERIDRVCRSLGWGAI